MKTEILAGLTTFMTMAYIIALNPNLLTNFAVGTPLWNGVFLATCLASALGTACMAFLANKPFVMAPGMGLNSFFAVVAGAVSGTSTVTTFVESASGVEAGGRTGLTALTAAFMFLACIFIAPIAAIIPAAATSAALIYVGILMLQGLQNIDFNDIDQIVPVFIMLLAMPISGSIGHGIGLAMICYTVIKVFSGKAKEVSVLTYVISALFLVKFFVVV